METIKIMIENKDGKNVMGIMRDAFWHYTELPDTLTSTEQVKSMIVQRANGKDVEITESAINPPVWK